MENRADRRPETSDATKTQITAAKIEIYHAHLAMAIELMNADIIVKDKHRKVRVFLYDQLIKLSRFVTFFVKMLLVVLKFLSVMELIYKQ